MQEENEANCAQMNEDFAARTADVRADYEKQIAELKA
jgi:chromosome segregation ATPase